ncbi:MAG: serine/threonine-protein kinase [Cyanobacteria bacterium P01_E01_bin.42]
MKESLHQSGDRIVKRYRIIAPLGEGSSSLTYEAVDLHTGDRVALKVLSLRHLSDWKMLELFEREARVLAQLDYIGIPKYLNFFQVEEPEEYRFYLVQELAQGESLASLIKNGWRLTEAEVTEIAIQILEILRYLHQLIPPVIHRDIKPQNIICQETKHIYLVDFGAVTSTYRHTITGGSTVVGTYGYMAPEQFRGQAVPATDLYGLGATVLFLLTGCSPIDFPQEKLKMDFCDRLDVSEQFLGWLDAMLEPAVEDRLATAARSLAILQGEEELETARSSHFRKPDRSPITIAKTKDNMFLKIPNHSFYKDRPLENFSKIINAIIFISIASYFLFIPSNELKVLSSIHKVLYCFCFPIVFGGIGSYFLFETVYANIGYTHLEFNRDNFYLQKSLLGIKRKRSGTRKNITHVGISDNLCYIIEGITYYNFGLYINFPEKEWIISEIKNFLES